jgi:1,4-dihydroxy-2-naphthoate octaprenyltransferase
MGWFLSEISAYLRLLFKTRLIGIPATLSASVAGSFSFGNPLGYTDLLTLFILYIGVFMAHLSVDSFDDYFDFKKDLARLKAGASDADLELLYILSRGSISARPLLAVGVSTMALGLLAGAYLSILRGPLVLVLALLGSMVILVYTGLLNMHGYLAEPLLVLKGLLVFMGSQLVAYGSIYTSTIPLGILFGLVSATVAYTHHTTHMPVDRSLGRITLPMLFERVGGPYVGYVLMIAMIYAVLLSLALSGILPIFSLAVLLAILIHMDIARRTWGKRYEIFSGYVIRTAIACRIVDVGLASILVITGFLNTGLA